MRVRAEHIFPFLLVALGASGCGAIETLWEYKKGSDEADLERGRLEQAKSEAAKQAERLEAVTAELDQLEAEEARMEQERAALKAEQARMEQERTSLEAEIQTAKGDESEQEELKAKLAALEGKLAENAEAQKKAQGGTSSNEDRPSDAFGPAPGSNRRQQTENEEDPLGAI